MNRYQLLFDRYVTELRGAQQAALAWWDELIDAEAGRQEASGAAEDVVRGRWPFGPASHPYVIAAYRKYFLACHDLNRRLDLEAHGQSRGEVEESETDWGADGEPEAAGDGWGEEWPIDPPTLLIEMLEGRDDELAEFMTSYVFPCIGEENGQPS